MCYSESVSWLTFAISWSSLLAFAFRRGATPDVIVLVVSCLFVSAMQMWEGLLWRDNESPFAVRGAYIFNVLQPIVVTLVGLAVQRVSTEAVVISAIFAVFYIQYTASRTTKISVSKKNDMLLYDWWGDMHAMPYIMFLVFAVIAFGGGFRYPLLALVVGSMLFSIVIRRGVADVRVTTNPARGSHWCWSFALGTILVHLL